MAPIVKRWGYWYDNDGEPSGWYGWGRWVLLGVVVAVAVIAFLVLQMSSCRRARHGQRPITGTAWMVPPSYYQATQQNPHDAVPLYRQQAGAGDAGHYDNNGNFVPLNDLSQQPGNNYADHYGPGSSSTAPQHPGYTYSGASNDGAHDYYPPPPGPPPGHSGDDYAPPPGPPPSHDVKRPNGL